MEQSVKRFNKKTLMKVLGIILVGALLVSLIPMMSNAGSSESINEKVTFLGTSVEVKGKSETNDQYKAYTSSTPIKKHEYVRITVDWEISDIVGLAPNDYFTVNLPSGLSYADYTGNYQKDINVDLDGTSTFAGYLSLKQSNTGAYYLTMVFDESFIADLETGEYDKIENGKFEVVGQATGNGDGDEVVTVGSAEITFNFEFGNAPYIVGGKKQNTASITKECQGNTNGKPEWNVITEDQMQQELFNKGDAALRENIIVEDTLPEGLVFNESNPFSLTYQRLYWVEKNSTGYDVINTALVLNYDKKDKEYAGNFTKIEDDDGSLSYAEFKDKVAEKPRQYGVYNETRIVVSLGDMPSNDIDMPAYKKLYERVMNGSLTINGKTADQIAQIRQDTLDVYTDLLYNGQSSDTSKSPAKSIGLRFNTVATSGDSVTNKAEISWKGSDVKSATSTITPKLIGGSADASSTQNKRAVELEKFDGESKTTLSGIKFQLEFYSESSQAFKPIASDRDDAEKITDKDGKINYNNLVPGKYRFVETEATGDYDISKVIFAKEDGTVLEDGEFTITEGAIQFEINAFNYEEDAIVPSTEPVGDGEDNPFIVDFNPDVDTDLDSSFAYPIMETVMDAVETLGELAAPLSAGTLGDTASVSTISDNETARSSGIGSSWALLNLILTILTGALALALIITWFTKKQENEDGINHNEMHEDTDQNIKKKPVLRILSIVMTVLAIVLFILTEDMTQPMIITDNYTIYHIGFFIITCLLTVFARKKYEDEDTQAMA